jgi:lysophospholipase L1-like esterase
MKFNLLKRGLMTLLAFSCTGLLADADAPSALTNAADVSVFPSLHQLPGKVPAHVWTGLGKVWARDHAQWKTTASNEVGAVVFLGDSITEGWKTLAQDFPKYKVANRGIGGDITSGVLYRLKADVLSLDPAAIILLIGTNDFGDGADTEDVAANIRLILLAIKNFNPNLKVVVCKVMPRRENGGQIYAEKIQKANSLVEQFVKDEPNFVVCDTWGIYADDHGDPKIEDFKPDRLHLNAAGYLVWKEALSPVIAGLHLKESKTE